MKFVWTPFIFCLFAVKVGDTRASDEIARDRDWAESHANVSASAEAILRDYYALALGDSGAIRSFRSLFLMRGFERAPRESGANEPRTRYLLFAPDGEDDDDGWPLVVWLHGSGDGEADLQHHMTTLARLFFPPPWRRGAYRFFFVSVLRPAKYESWSAAPGGTDDMLGVVSAIIDEVVREFPIDTSRITLVGASSGGTGCWELALRNSRRFAAVAPLASGGGDPTRARKMINVPVWAFHSTGDAAVPIDRVRRTVRVLNDAGGVARLTEFESSDHDSWTPAFDDYDLLNWLLAQTRGESNRYPPGSRPFAVRTRPLVKAVAAAVAWVPWMIIPLAAVIVPLVLKLRRRRA